MVLFFANTKTPSPLGMASPVGTRPMWFDATVFPSPASSMPRAVKPVITRPRIAEPPPVALTSKPVPTTVPPWTRTRVPEPNPGWVVPSMWTPSVICGSDAASVMIVDPLMLKAMVSSAGALALALRIAWRSVPGPLSALLVTK